jgi:hypothetical protein
VRGRRKWQVAGDRYPASPELETCADHNSRPVKMVFGYQIVKGYRVSPALSLLIILLLAVLFTQPAPLAAQNHNQLPSYWRYDAPGRLDHIVVADVTQNGLDEILLAAEDVNVVLVGADGLRKWPPYVTPDPIRKLAVIDILGADSPGLEIVIATPRQLIALNSTGLELWQTSLPALPVGVDAFDHNGEGGHAVLVTLANGLLQLYDKQGGLIWEYVDSLYDVSEGSYPHVAVGDLKRSGRDEVALAYFSVGRFTKMVLIDSDGQLTSEKFISGRVTALSLVEFTPDAPLAIALGTLFHTQGRVHLFDHQGQEQWYRTPNKPISSLAVAEVNGGTALIVGTGAGTILAYDQQGRRYWSHAYADNANRQIAALWPNPHAGEGSLAISLLAVVSRDPSSSERGDVLLLDGDGHVLESYAGADTNGLTRLVDVNRDGKSELLLASFATLTLLDPGIGSREYAEAWDYWLGAQAQSILVADVDRNDQDELVIGTNDGRIHLLRRDGNTFQPTLIADELGGIVSQLALASRPETLNELVVVHNNRIVSGDGVETFEGWLRLLRSDGRVVWYDSLPTSITSLRVGDITGNGVPEIIVGTTDGQVIAYSLKDNRRFWTTSINGSVKHILLMHNDRGTEIVTSSKANEIARFSNKGTNQVSTAFYLQEINSLHRISQEGDLAAQLLVAVEDGTVRGLNARGVELWQQELAGIPIVVVPAQNSFLVATDESELLRLDYDGNVLWQLRELGRISSVYWGDLDGDTRPDVAVGNREGQVLLFTSDGSEMLSSLNLGSPIVYLTALRSDPEQQAELVVITNNGGVKLFRAQPNRPPLLFNPQTEVAPGSYGINVSVVDVDDDPVHITLEIYDPELREWVSQGTKTAATGNDTIPWLVDPPSQGEVHYRFLYNDGSHSGIVRPAAGPSPTIRGPRVTGSLTALAIMLTLLFSGAILAHQARSPEMQVRRFYKRLKQSPENSLELLEKEYNRTAGSPDFLLYLANLARQDQIGPAHLGKRLNRPLAGLADGLFLLAARPTAALPIIQGALEEAAELKIFWLHLPLWRLMAETVQSLLEAPSVMELSLLRPQLSHLLEEQQKVHGSAGALAALLPILTSLRDSERVDMVEDRLVYLNEASLLLREHRAWLQKEPVQIDTMLATTLVSRWTGLVNAESEELRGRAQLVVTLKTKRVAPADRTVIALAVLNSGRAPAEHIVVTMEENPAYHVGSQPQTIAYLPPGRTRQVTFHIEPQVNERFRVAFTLNYDDRHHWRKEVAFADMVHLLPPAREFSPVANPYAPGTPLRRNSDLFVGREDLFEFVGQTAGRLSQQNVLILIGQRRTGKTSALLQLDQHLPSHLLPVYIDCQSLGVVPGMPALFHDLAWIVADALTLHGYDLAVPDPIEWQEDPAGRFQRHFLPATRALLPAGTILLLVFDEFEAFENLVNDGILPPTLFTYLRHLMQHGEGLSFIFVGTRRLEEMSTDYWSVLFNIALYWQVGYLSLASAERLICAPVSPHLVYDDLAIDKIIRVTAGHPYFLQLVCYTLVNQANRQRQGYVTISDVNAALEEMLRLGEVHFAYLWQRSSHTERALLMAMAHLIDQDGPFHPSELIQFLSDYSLYLDPAEVLDALHQLVERGIVREITDEGAALYELRIGLVGLWVAHNKSLSRLHESRQPLRESVRV